MVGLVLEGGTFRPIYSAGIMDAFLKEGIMLPYCVGVSAGICDGASYISRQPERNLEILRRYRHDKRYVGIRNFFGSKSLFGLDFAYDELPNRWLPFDWDTFYSYEGKFMVGVTNALTGEGEFLEGHKMDRACTMLRATCAIPLMFPPILIDGVPYYDGGLVNPIPYRKALSDGCKKLIIILTRPDGYRKTLTKSAALAAKKMKKKYPAISEILLSRHDDYNAAAEECRRLEKEGRALIFRPEYPLNSMEKDISQIEKNYRMGFDLAEKRMDEVKAFLR